MVQAEKLEEFFAALRPRVRGDLRSDDYSRILYSTDASIYQLMPYGVFLPRDRDDLQAAVATAAEFGIPLLPRAGGSSLAGQCVNEALVIDTTRHLNQIVEVNREERWARVEPGLVLDEFNLALQQYDLQFGPDPASSNRAAMGGIVSNNSTGSHSILYGMTADHVLETQALLSDGSLAHFRAVDESALAGKRSLPGLEGRIYCELDDIRREHAELIRRATPQHWRRCGGYNLDRLAPQDLSFRFPHDQRFNLANILCGAEGSLAVLSEIKVNLVPRPQMTALAIVQFDSLHEALSAVPHILEVEPSAVEMVDNLGLTMCREVPAYARLLATFLEGRPNCILITEFYGASRRELSGKVEQLGRHLRQRRIACSMVPALEAAQQRNVWTVRKVGLGLMMSVKGDYKPIPFIEDAAVPVEHLADYVAQIEDFCKELGSDVAYYAHASAGCIHIRPMINTKDAREIEKLPAIGRFSMELVKRYGGALSSEHGDGRARGWLNEAFFGPELFALFRRVKAAFDPHNLLNPGNIAEPAAMTDNLRYGSDYRTQAVDSLLDFSADQGFHRAVEMCNGAGICRKRTTGTMCPSFMVTREEEDSTRGRANALRAALAGHLPAGELGSERMYRVMDLCVECKACKAECPSAVDMAKIKFEFLAQYHKVNGIPRRSRLFGDIARWSALGSGALAPLINRSMRSPLLRRGVERTLGITARRPMPSFASEPFTLWFARRAQSRLPRKAAREVVLFNDTFTTYNDPHIGIAATELLEAAGYTVRLPGHVCCGRPMISKGLVEQARAAARQTLDRLTPFAERNVPIVGLEPSCILSLRDEYLYLLPKDERAAMVARTSYTFEEFIDLEEERDALKLDFDERERHLLLHGHCHQKALVGTAASIRALTLPEGHQVTEVDSGCCGMAGSFGYEAEHYDISMQMAERRLLPAVRSAAAETVIVASGTSCRHQIGHGAQRRALHPVEVLRDALRNPKGAG